MRTKSRKKAKSSAGIYSVDSLLDAIYPRLRENDRPQKGSPEELEWWLQWPPDVFAPTSAVLVQTGAYRYLVSLADEDVRRVYDPDSAFSDDKLFSFARHGTQEHVREGWLGYVSGEGSFKPDLNPQSNHRASPGTPAWGLEEVTYRMRTLLNDLRNVELGRLNLEEAEQVSERRAIANILWLHAAADETCQNFGVLAGGFGRTNLSYLTAQSMLEVNSSLSRLPRSFGVVLPKMRTPQRGLTVRSLSHHLSFHRSEIHAAWRSFP